MFYIIIYLCFVKLPSKYLENAIDQIASLPGIGKKTALRLVLNLHNRTPEEILDFSQSFIDLKNNVKNCSECGNITDELICDICCNNGRDHQTICIVEDIRDVLAIESTNSFTGTYHVLGGIISPMDGVGPRDLNIDSLLPRINEKNVAEVIFALSATMEGDTTNFYIYKKIKDLDITISSLSRGVSVGSELQYADEITLGRSIANRQPYSL